MEAGSALAVDREGFAKTVTEKIKSIENIEIVAGELDRIPEGRVIIATGPLTSDAQIDAISGLTSGGKYLNFYDAAAPIVTFESIDMERAFFASRYDKGTPDYINCPLTKEEYTPSTRSL